MAHILGQIDELVIAEAAAAGTPLVGKSFQQAHNAHLVDAAIAGVWEGEYLSCPMKPKASLKKVFLF